MGLMDRFRGKTGGYESSDRLASDLGPPPSGPAPGFRREAHGTSDDRIVSHCPMCGSGRIWGRSDGLVTCEYCHTTFQVRIQPTDSFLPQTEPEPPPEPQPPDQPTEYVGTRRYIAETSSGRVAMTEEDYARHLARRHIRG